jgi:hypothetical protein
MGLRPPKVMKNGFCSATTLNGSVALPFVISTEVPKERSGEICGSAVLSWKCFSLKYSAAFAKRATPVNPQYQDRVASKTCPRKNHE